MCCDANLCLVLSKTSPTLLLKENWAFCFVSFQPGLLRRSCGDTRSKRKAAAEEAHSSGTGTGAWHTFHTFSTHRYREPPGNHWTAGVHDVTKIPCTGCRGLDHRDPARWWYISNVQGDQMARY